MRHIYRKANEGEEIKKKLPLLNKVNAGDGKNKQKTQLEK